MDTALNFNPSVPTPSKMSLPARLALATLGTSALAALGYGVHKLVDDYHNPEEPKQASLALTPDDLLPPPVSSYEQGRADAYRRYGIPSF
jgi:hypothetical protein